MDEDDIARYLAKQIEAELFKAMMGPPRKQKQTALRLSASGSLQVVELDDAGKIIEPPPRCCYGTIMHAPNCKSWLVCT